MDTLAETLACIKSGVSNELKFIRTMNVPRDSGWAFALAEREILDREVSRFELKDICKDTQQLTRLVNRIGYCKSEALTSLSHICSLKE